MPFTRRQRRRAIVRPMSESILDEAIGYARARLDLLDDDHEKRVLASRLDLLEASARRVMLPMTDAVRIVRLVSAVLALRDDIVACGESQHRAGHARRPYESGAYEVGHARVEATPTEADGVRPRAASHVDVHGHEEPGLARALPPHLRVVKRAETW